MTFHFGFEEEGAEISTCLVLLTLKAAEEKLFLRFTWVFLGSKCLAFEKNQIPDVFKACLWRCYP